MAPPPGVALVIRNGHIAVICGGCFQIQLHLEVLEIGASTPERGHDSTHSVINCVLCSLHLRDFGFVILEVSQIFAMRATLVFRLLSKS